MTILAIMQNQWLKNHELHQRRFDAYKLKDLDRWKEYWRRGVAYALFAGCRSGRVLESHLGKELCREIIWDESTTVITGSPSECPPADLEHIQWTMEDVRPDVVLTLGRSARLGFESTRDKFGFLGGIHIPAPHPACRAPADHARLKTACATLKSLVDAQGQPR